jgi:hypothetical protein
MAAGLVSPSAYDNDLITLLEAGRLRQSASDLVDLAGNLVPWGERRLVILAKISVHELHVGAAHPCRSDLEENLVGFDVRHRNILQNERLVVTVHACCSH